MTSASTFWVHNYVLPPFLIAQISMINFAAAAKSTKDTWLY